VRSLFGAIFLRAASERGVVFTAVTSNGFCASGERRAALAELRPHKIFAQKTGSFTELYAGLYAIAGSPFLPSGQAIEKSTRTSKA
jgi:hypothetical protein